MKVETLLFLLVSAFLLVVGGIYGVWSDWSEPVGSFGLFLCGGLGLMIGFYLWMTARKLPERPEDNPAGEIAEQEGEYGVFAPHSWWPLWLGLTAATCFLGLAVGWWLVIIGASFGVVAVVGWTFESYRGHDAL